MENNSYSHLENNPFLDHILQTVKSVKSLLLFYIERTGSQIATFSSLVLNLCFDAGVVSNFK